MELITHTVTAKFIEYRTGSYFMVDQPTARHRWFEGSLYGRVCNDDCVVAVVYVVCTINALYVRENTYGLSACLTAVIVAQCWGGVPAVWHAQAS